MLEFCSEVIVPGLFLVWWALITVSISVNSIHLFRVLIPSQFSFGELYLSKIYPFLLDPLIFFPTSLLVIFSNNSLYVWPFCCYVFFLGSGNFSLLFCLVSLVGSLFLDFVKKHSLWFVDLMYCSFALCFVYFHTFFWLFLLSYQSWDCFAL